MADPWLERWLPLLVARAGTQPVLEIGCGSGDDTATLVRAGLKVTAIDRSATSVAKARRRVPEARIECQNVREPFPSGVVNLGAVVASLSLHYFAWLETLALVSRTRDALRSGGLLLCRLNSTEDHNYGASGHPQIEPNFYMVNGEPKRFFDEKSVLELFATGWRRLSVEHFVTHKYAMPKALWEVVLERDT